MLNNKNRPAIIVAPFSSGNYFAPKFKEFNVSSIAIMSTSIPKELYESSYFPEDFEEILFVDDDFSLLVEKLKILNPLCIIAGSEPGVELADKLTSILMPKLSNNPEKTEARRHKGEMSKAVFEAGLPITPQICSNSVEDLEHWIIDNNLLNTDLVIKPPKSAGTDDVIKIPKRKGLEKSIYRNARFV